jgi:hypothetical protein
MNPRFDVIGVDQLRNSAPSRSTISFGEWHANTTQRRHVPAASRR